MLPSKFIRSNSGRCLSVILATLLFSGCAGQKPDSAADYTQGKRTANSAWYLQQMQQSANNSKTAWQLLAIHALLREGKIQQAIELYNQLPQKQNMSNTQQNEKNLLSAEINVVQKNYSEANVMLAGLNPFKLDAQQQARYYQAVIKANQNHPSLGLLRAYIAQEPMLHGSEHQQNIDNTWQTLLQLSPEQAGSLVINANENTLQGWLDLQRVWNDNLSDPEMLKAGIKDWQTRYPRNPAAIALPTQLKSLQSYKSASIQKIALMLPLNGQAAVFGRAIQSGFEAAKNNLLPPTTSTNLQTSTELQRELPVNDENNDTVSPSSASITDLTNEQPQTPPPTQIVNTPVSATSFSSEIKVYDTSSRPLSQLLAQAQQDGVTLVIGPLLKSEVNTLSTSNISLNILALNQPEQIQNRMNICYFALSPEDEARGAAQHIWQQGARTPLLLIPNTTFGDRVAKAFNAEWSALGGEVVLQQKFGAIAQLKQAINAGAGIALTGTPVSLPSWQDNTLAGDVTVPSTPVGSSSDLSGKPDAAYIVATPDEIALIKPMITMRTGSQNPVKLYASSRSSQGGMGTDFNLEMNGLEFSDIPLLSGYNPALMQQALNSLNNNYSLVRLYAMGIDAWTLANRFSQIRHAPGTRIAGNTGELSSDQDCVISRKLNWLQFRQGQIVPAS